MEEKRKGIHSLLVLWCISLVVLLGLSFYLVKKIRDRSDIQVNANVNVTKEDGIQQQVEVEQSTVATPIPVRVPEEIVFLENRTQLAGEAVETFGLNAVVRYGLRYPKFDNSEISTLIEQKANELLLQAQESYKEEGLEEADLPVIVVDYDSYQKEQLLSVIFFVKSELEEKETIQKVSMLYNMVDNTQITSEELFRASGFAFLREKMLEQIKETETDATVIAELEQTLHADAKTFSDFTFTEEEIVFSVDVLGGQTLSIPYETLNSYVNITWQGMHRLARVRELDPEKPMIAITFDDGPHWTNTEKLVDILNKYDARATFFMLGSRAVEIPDVVKYVYDAGNEVASHTYSHKDLATLGEEEFWYEVNETNKVLSEITGQSLVYLRPPYGSRNQFVMDNLPMVVVCWNVDTEDWKSRDKNMVFDEVMKNASDGNIVLLHDIHTSTIEAAELFVPALVQKGYQLVTLEELFYYRGVEAVPGKVYYNSR